MKFLIFLLFPFILQAADNWVFDESWSSNGMKDSDEFGAVISASGDILAVGAPGQDNDRGSVFLFQRNKTKNEDWQFITQLKLFGLISAEGDRFGAAISVYKELIAIGIPGRDNTGMVQIFHRHEGGSDKWGHLHTSTQPANSRNFGAAVAISEQFLWVGDPTTRASNGTLSAGRAYVFARNIGDDIADIWASGSVIDSPLPTIAGRFGTSIAISNDRAVIGEPNASGGKAHLYRHDIKLFRTWQFETSLEETGYLEFGHAVSIYHQQVAVGAPGSNDNTGLAFVFEQTAFGDWKTQATLSPSSGSFKNRFGQALSIYQNRITVGAPGANSVSLFSRSATNSPWGLIEEFQPTLPGTAPATGSAVAQLSDRNFFGSPGAIFKGEKTGQVNSLQETTTQWGVVDEVETLTTDDFTVVRVFDEVALSGDLMAVQAAIRETPAGGGRSGIGVVLYRREGLGDTAEWVIEKIIPHPSVEEPTTFGTRIELVGETLLIAEVKRFDNPTSGIYHFERHEGGSRNWGWVTTLREGFDISDIGFDGRHLIVGTIPFGGLSYLTSDNSVSLAQGAQIYRRTPGGVNEWFFVTTFDPDDGNTSTGDEPWRFGNSVAVCGDLAIVGAPSQGDFIPAPNQQNPDALGLDGIGGAYVFRRNEGGADAWGQIARMEGNSAFRAFGTVVAIEGNRMAVSATQTFTEQGSTTPEGRVHVYELTTPDAEGLIPEIANFIRPDGESSQFFGADLAISNGMISTCSLNTITGTGEIHIFQAAPAASPGNFLRRSIFITNGLRLAFDGRRMASMVSFASDFFQIIEPVDGSEIKNYAWWAQLNFPDSYPDPAQETTTWGKSADPDRDGLNNLLEAFFDTNPNIANPSPLTIDYNRIFNSATLTYPMNSEIVGITGRLQQSRTLTGWGNVSLAIDQGGITTLPDGRFLITAVDTGLSNIPKNLYRLRIQCID